MNSKFYILREITNTKGVKSYQTFIKQDMFVKHYAPGTKFENAIYSLKVKSRS